MSSIFILFSLIIAELVLPREAAWNQNGITVAGASNGTPGSSPWHFDQPLEISTTNDDMLYVTDTDNHRIVVINLNSTSNISIIGSGPGNSSNQFDRPSGILVRNNSLYVLDSNNHRIQEISLNDSNSSATSLLTEIAYSYNFYISNDNDIYLSLQANHCVLLYPMNSVAGIIVAGTGVQGSNANQLDTPFGIFVSEEKTIYVADRDNHRVMKWLLGASAGILVAGNGIHGFSSTQLYHPTQVIVDTNGYMYISEYGNSRITRWGPNSTFGSCIAACTGTVGIDSNQLYGPYSLAFDRHGSLYVSDRLNNRVQKFPILSYNSEYSLLTD